MKNHWIPTVLLLTLASAWSFTGCKKDETTAPEVFKLSKAYVNNQEGNGFVFNDLGLSNTITLQFSAPVDTNGLQQNLVLTGNGSKGYTCELQGADSILVIHPLAAFQYLNTYIIYLSQHLSSKKGTELGTQPAVTMRTRLDTTDKFPRISDEELLDLVQKNTFKYFYDYAHPVSGLARERLGSDETVTTGGSGFGIMALIVGVHRGFITRQEGLERLLKITGFLTTKAQRFHGVFPHWMNGTSGTKIPFSTKDNGGDLVETSFMMQGLLAARQFFDGSDAQETNLRQQINSLWDAVEWDWYRQNNQNVLYWHWSPDYAWAMNMPIRGWNEALIVYVLAASSNTHAIDKAVYDNGWAQNGAIVLNQGYYGFHLPLGWPYGGPMFFAHYSFLGLDPRNLHDAYASYWEQNVSHTFINYTYCVKNPNGKTGYNAECWGLTASDLPSGYGVSEPTNDRGVIAPTAALASMPYAPEQSKAALRYFYYKLGNRLWGEYGFKDAFALGSQWFAPSYLAIDQGPEIVMIENYRSGLIWNLFMSAPEVKAGLTKLGFTY